jgi:hypothetical protein
MTVLGGWLMGVAIVATVADRAPDREPAGALGC